MFIIPRKFSSTGDFYYTGYQRSVDWNVTNFLNWIKISNTRNYNIDNQISNTKILIQKFLIKNVLFDSNNLDIQIYYDIKINDEIYNGYCYNYFNKNNIIINNSFYDDKNKLYQNNWKKNKSLINNYILKKIESFLKPKKSYYKIKTEINNKKIWLMDINKNNKIQLNINDIFEVYSVDYINKIINVIYNNRKWEIEPNDFYWLNILAKRVKKKKK